MTLSRERAHGRYAAQSVFANSHGACFRTLARNRLVRVVSHERLVGAIAGRAEVRVIASSSVPTCRTLSQEARFCVMVALAGEAIDGR